MACASKQRLGHLCNLRLHHSAFAQVCAWRLCICELIFAGGLQSKQSAAVCDLDEGMNASCSSHRGWFVVDFLSTFPLWAVVLGCLDGSGYDTATYRYWALLQLLAMACLSCFLLARVPISRRSCIVPAAAAADVAFLSFPQLLNYSSAVGLLTAEPPETKVLINTTYNRP